MPRIVVLSDATDEGLEVLWSERVHAANLASAHFRNQLVERLSWAVEDAHHVEQSRGHDDRLSSIEGGLSTLDSLRNRRSEVRTPGLGSAAS